MTCKISCQVGKCKSLEMRGGNVFGSETREKWFWEVETASRKIVVLSKEKKEGGGGIYLVKIHLLKRKISNFTRIHYFALFSSRYTLRIVQILRRTNKIHSPLVHRIFDIPEERRISTVSLQFFFSLFFFFFLLPLSSLTCTRWWTPTYEPLGTRLLHIPHEFLHVRRHE